MKPVIYVVANKGLNMSAGKLAAQCAHAVMGLTADTTSNWLDYHHRWMIILEADDAMHLASIRYYLEERKVRSYMVVDEGVNEIPPLTCTALAVGILEKDSVEAGFLSGLKKYKYSLTPIERNSVWNAAIDYMHAKPWYKRLWKLDKNYA